MEIFVGFIVAIIMIIMIIFDSNKQSNQKEANKKTEEINNFASNFVNNLISTMNQIVSHYCGADFFVFCDVNKAIINKNLSADYEDLLIKTEILKQDDDIRLFNEKEITNIMTNWLSLTCIQIMRTNHMEEKESVEMAKKISKAYQLISIIEGKYIEQYGDEMLAVVNIFKKEENPSVKVCDIILDGMKKIMERAKNEFEKEVVNIKEKYLSSIKFNN